MELGFRLWEHSPCFASVCYVCANILRCQVDSCFISVIFVCLMHSGKDFIKIRPQQQAEQSELSREEQGPRVIFHVLLPVLKES